MTKPGTKSAVAWALIALLGTDGRLLAQVACVGDCNDNGAVAINEIITCVNIALGNSTVVACMPCDSNGNGTVAINELIQAVNAALNGCEGMAATPTATATLAPPTATPVIENVAGAAAAVANSVASIPNLIAAVVTGLNGGQTAALSGLPGGGAGDVDPCELGGSVTQSGSLPSLTLTFMQCAVSRGSGSAVFDGTMTVNITNLLMLSGTGTFDATITFRDAGGIALAETVTDLQASVRLFVEAAPGDPCAFEVPIAGDVRLNRLDLTNLTGTLATAVASGETSIVTWAGTAVSIAIETLSADCVPVGFDVTVNGDATIERQASSAPGAVISGGVAAVVFDVTFADFVLSATGAGDDAQIEISGDLTSTCIGDTVTLSTPQSLSFVLGNFCPVGGTLTVQDIGDIVYSPEGVTVGGMSYASCSDPALLQCVE